VVRAPFVRSARTGPETPPAHREGSAVGRRAVLRVLRWAQPANGFAETISTAISRPLGAA
jgi:hypothetical protein